MSRDASAADPSPGEPAQPRGLLAIFAHPDDESFGCGGTLALAAESGVPVWLICATNGDQGGRPGEDVADHSMDGEIRMDELREACRALGINPPIFLGYRDSGMEGWGAPPGSLAVADPAEAVERIAAEIRRLRPATIVTFDPGGIYGHPDHVTISARATDAYRRAAGEPGGPRALYHQAVPRSSVTRLLELMAQRSPGADGAPAREPSEDDRRQAEAFVRFSRPDEEITTIVDVRSVIDRKTAALQAHASQTQGRDFGEDGGDAGAELFGREAFILVDPAPEPGLRETSLRGLA